MSMRTRVGRLEEKSNSNFRVTIPVGLDADGNEFVYCPQDERLAGARFACDGVTVEVSRLEDEAVRDFEKRAHAAVLKEFPGILILWLAPGVI